MRIGACLHYKYLAGVEGGPACALGIDIGAKFRPCWPCWTGNDPQRASATCDRYTEPTAEQLAAEQAEGTQAVERVLTALAAIERAEAGDLTPGQVHTITCPCCGVGVVRWQRSGRSLVAACSTPKCVEFRGRAGR